VVASAAGHGMMWGPAVAQVAADLTATGSCEWLDLTDLGLDRFDAEGNSRVAPRTDLTTVPPKGPHSDHQHAAPTRSTPNSRIGAPLDEATDAPMATQRARGLGGR